MTLSEDDIFRIRFQEGQICALLGIDGLNQIDSRVEIPSSGLETALRDLYKQRSEYDCILFESPGQVKIANTRMQYTLPFQLAKISFSEGRYRIWHGFLIDTVNHHWGDLSHERPPIRVVRPTFWTSWYGEGSKPDNKRDNEIRLHFGSFFKQVNLTLDARWNLQDENGADKYRPASAFGYKIHQYEVSDDEIMERDYACK